MKFKAKNTVKSYNTYFKHFCTWCKKFDFPALPASDYHVALYLSFLQKDLHSDYKINNIVYGISFAHKLANLPDPCCSNLIKNVKDGLIRSVGKQHNAKDPISIKELDLIAKHFGTTDSLINMRFVAMSLLSFSGFFRFNEVVSLRRSDICIKKDHVELSIVKSKTDQIAKGSVVIVSRTGQNTCPVTALERYLTMAHIPENSSHYIFRKISFFKKSGIFKLRQGSHLSYTRAREIFLQNIPMLGLDKSKFGLHSFRSGGATSASNSGVSDRLIKKHGRWKTDIA